MNLSLNLSRTVVFRTTGPWRSMVYFLMRTAKWAVLLIAAFMASIVWHEFTRPELLIVGSVTEDIVDGASFIGGAVSYAAVVASAFGANRACIVTTAKAGRTSFPPLEGHDVHIIPSNATLAFEHSYTFWGNNRKLRVATQPNVSLSLSHVPWQCRRARTILLCPLTQHDVEVESFQNHQPWLIQRLLHRILGTETRIGLLAQGLQRSLNSEGGVSALPHPSEALKRALGPNVVVFLSDVETDVWPKGAIADTAARCNRVLVTRGPAGADEFISNSNHEVIHHPAVAVTLVQDTNGAGDSFAVGYMLAAARGHRSPAFIANWAGSIVVTQPQKCKPECIKTAIKEAMNHSITIQ